MDPDALEGDILKPEFYFSEPEYILQTERKQPQKRGKKALKSVPNGYFISASGKITS